jgi:hypothetical protein
MLRGMTLTYPRDIFGDGTGTGTTQYTWNAEGRTATVTPWGGTATT